jgi:ribosome modulation factor
VSVVMKQEVVAEGYRAYYLGDQIGDNPYYPNDFRSLDWIVGWKRGKTDEQAERDAEEQAENDLFQGWK